MKDVGISKGLVKKFDTEDNTGIYGFRKMFQVYLNKLGVPFNDPCCPDASTASDNVTTDSIAEKTAGAGVTVDGVKLKDGGVTSGTQIAGFYPTAVAQNNITAGTGGAIIVTNYSTTINTDAGGDAFTLANGTQIGQLKKIRLVVDDGGNGVVTPTALTGGTTITFDDAGDYVVLIWSGTSWIVLENSGVTVA